MDADEEDNYESELIRTPVACVNETLRYVHINEAFNKRKWNTQGKVFTR